MRRRIIPVVAGVLSVAGLAAAAPAVAEVVDPVVAGHRPAVVVTPDGTGVYVLTVRAAGRPARHALLACRPTAGTHPSARRACDQLRAAGGEIRRIPAADGFCTAEYAPVTVTAAGAWRAEERHYSQEFANSCHAVRDTGGVLFNF